MNGPLGLTLCKALHGPERGEKWMTALFFIGDTGMIMASSWFARRFSVRNLAIAYAVIFLLGSLGAWLAPTWATFLPTLFLLGIGYGGASVLYNAVFAAEFHSGKKVQWLLVLNGFWGVGAVVGPRIVSQWIDSPRVPHEVLFLGGLAGLVAAFALKPGGLASEPRTDVAAPSNRVWVFAAIMAIYVGAEVAVGALTPRHLFQFHQLKLKSAIELTAMLWLVYSIARFVLGPVVAALGPRRTVIGGCIASGLLLIATRYVGEPKFILPVVGMFMAPVFPAVMGWASSEGGDEHRTAAILITTAGFGAAIVPFVVDEVVGVGAAMPLVVGAIFALGGIVALSVRPIHKAAN